MSIHFEEGSISQSTSYKGTLNTEHSARKFWNDFPARFVLIDGIVRAYVNSSFKDKGSRNELEDGMSDSIDFQRDVFLSLNSILYLTHS